MQNEIRSLRDTELLASTKSLVEREREITTRVLRHLAEIERRKLFAELRCGSLFEYAVRELRYSEAAAARRIQAMRLLREIPALEEKIESGALSLSNISQAQSYFREIRKAEPQRVLRAEDKIEVLTKLEDKSAREGERILLSMTPPSVLPRERERVVSPEHTEVKFLMDQNLKSKLDEVRSLLGPKGSSMTLAELMLEMASLSSERLQEKRFGKRRVDQARSQTALVLKAQGPSQTADSSGTCSNEPFDFTDPDVGVGRGLGLGHVHAQADPDAGVAGSGHLQAEVHSDVGVDGAHGNPRSLDSGERRTRYIPRAVKYAVWSRSDGKCSSCGSRHRLEYDHVQPHALGGDASPENIRLLCASCNLRRGVKTFGLPAMRRA